MAIDQFLLDILVCPESRMPVKPAPAELLQTLNERIRAGGVKAKSGAAVAEPLEEALVREDGKVLYPVREGIPVMLAEEAILI